MKNFTISIFLLLAVCLISTAFIEEANDVCVVGNSSQMIGANNTMTFMNNSLVVGSANDITYSNNSIIGGLANKLDGEQSFVFGTGSTVDGNSSTGLGESLTVNGNNNFASGSNGYVIGDANFMFSSGNSANINGEGNFMAGSGSSINADNTFVFGDGANINHNGCFVFGGSNLVSTGVSASPPLYFNGQIITNENNQVAFNATGGYYIYTGASGIGTSLDPGSSSWNFISNKDKKHNFYNLNPANILDKYRSFGNHVTWSYKGHDVRNYGPMAQDFYAAFGEDGYGKIGTDTTISTHNIASVNLIAVYELEKRTRLQKEQLDLQATMITTLLEEVETLKETNSQIVELEEKLKEITASLEL